MCRLLAFAMERGGPARELLSALREAARRECFHAKLKSHGDGWGYAVALLRGGRWSTAYYKSATPIWEDEELDSLARLIEQSEAALGVVHARKASKGTPVTAFCAHPYPVSADDGSVLYVAQNGEVYIEKAMAMLGRKLEGVSDSQVYAALLAKRYSPGSGAEGLAHALASLQRELEQAGATKAYLNTAVLYAAPGDSYSVALITAVYRPSELRECRGLRARYCDIYLLEEGGYAYFSSTVAAYLGTGRARFAGWNKVFTVEYREGGFKAVVRDLQSELSRACGAHAP